MTHETAEKLSAFIGLLGGLLLAVPFFADFRARRKRVRRLRALDDGTLAKEDAAALRVPIGGAELERTLSADSWMAVMAGAGATGLILSFLILLAA